MFTLNILATTAQFIGIFTHVVAEKNLICFNLPSSIGSNNHGDCVRHAAFFLPVEFLEVVFVFCHRTLILYVLWLMSTKLHNIYMYIYIQLTLSISNSQGTRDFVRDRESSR